MMITLKAALVGASCVGALAIGGVTYATVAQPDAGLRSDRAKLPDAKPAAPAPAPTAPKCPPKPGDVKHAVPQHPAAGAQQDARQTVEEQAQKVDAANKVPANLPQSVPAASQHPVKPAPVPGDNCLPNKLPKDVKPADPAKPNVPNLPPLKKVDCDTVKPAIALGGPAEKALILSRGLGKGTKNVEVITHKTHNKTHKLCKVTVKWVGGAGQWLKVERVKTPRSYNLDQLRQALRLPAGGAPVSVHGVRGWQTPLGSAVIWYSEGGFALVVEGSPAYAPQLHDVAAKLQQQAQEVR